MKNLRRLSIVLGLLITPILFYSCQTNDKKGKEVSEGLLFAILRNLDKGVKPADTTHGYAIMDFNPFSKNFGAIKQSVNGPLGHHGYVSAVNGGIYVSLADRLVARVDVSISADGNAVINKVSKALDDGGMRVGEDIVWFKENGLDRYAVTSLDGNGDDKLGAVNVYDANTDKLIRSITDSKKLRYLHGISIFDDKPLALVTSVIHEDIALYGIPSVDSLGHEVSLVNLATGEVIKNYELGTTAQGFPVAPVECAIFRKSFHPNFDKNEKALVVEMVSGNLVSADWNEKEGMFNEFKVAYTPKDEKEYFPLEIFSDSTTIYVTYAERVKTFDLLEYAATGKLIDAGVEYITKSCAHHLSFFDATNPKTGKKVPVLLIQQNLLNLGQQPFNIKFGLPIDLGMHEVTAYNRLTGEVLNTVNIATKYNKGVEYVGGIRQDAYLHHH
jgi:hypothetical protein